MPSKIVVAGPLNSSFVFNLQIRDWNGDELPILQSELSQVGLDSIDLVASTSAIGTATVGMVTCVVRRVTANDTGAILFRGLVLATVDILQRSTKIAIVDNAVVAEGGTARVPFGTEPATGFVPRYNQQPVRLLTAFQAGHGWSFYTSGGASPFGNLNETAGTQRYGSQHAWAGTAGGAVAGFAGVQRFAMAPIDTTGKTLRITFKIVNKANLQEFGLFIGTSSLANYCRIYAHSNQSQWLYREGEVVTIDYPLGTRTFAAAADYAVTGAPTMNAITDIRLRVMDGALGASMGSVELHIYEVSLVTNRSTPKIVFQFDDEDESVYTIAYPIMKAAGIVGNNYIICDKVDTAGKMTKAMLDELHIERWCHCAHTYADANHDARLVTMTAEAVEADQQACKDWLNARGYRGANHSAYPGGDFDSGSVSRLSVMRKLFRTARSINTRQSETFPVSLPHRLRTIYCTSTTTAQTVKDRIDCVVLDSKGMANIVFHRIVPGAPAINTEYQTANFQAIIDHVVAQGYVQYCTTMSDLEADGLI